MVVQLIYIALKLERERIKDIIDKKKSVTIFQRYLYNHFYIKQTENIPDAVLVSYFADGGGVVVVAVWNRDRRRSSSTT